MTRPACKPHPELDHIKSTIAYEKAPSEFKTVYFHAPMQLVYIAEYLPITKENPHVSKNEGEWKLSLLTYHKTRNGVPVKSKKQTPRFKLVGYFSTIEACEDFLGVKRTS